MDVLDVGDGADLYILDAFVKWLIEDRPQGIRKVGFLIFSLTMSVTQGCKVRLLGRLRTARTASETFVFHPNSAHLS
jgi:hypothetical protein